MLFSPVISDVNFDHLGKVMVSRFHHCEVSIFTLVSIVGDSLRLCKYPILHQTYVLVFTFIDDSFFF